MSMTFVLPQTPHKFTAAEQTILEYIAMHSSEFLCMTIGQLSAALHLSEATISRFARHVGCFDFKHLKQVIVDQIVQKEGPAQKLANTLNAGQGGMLSDWIRQQQYQLEKTLELSDSSAFSDAVSAMRVADRVFLFAKNASRAPAQLLEFRLRRIGVDARLVSACGTALVENLALMRRGDLAVIFSFSKLSAEARLIFQHQKSAGYRTLLFTSRFYPDEINAPDIRLYVYRGEENAYHPMGAPVAVVEALALALSAVQKSDAVSQLETIQNLKSAYRSL